MKRVVIDTNVMLVAVSKNSKDHWIVKALFDEKYEFIYDYRYSYGIAILRC